MDDIDFFSNQGCSKPNAAVYTAYLVLITTLDTRTHDTSTMIGMYSEDTPTLSFSEHVQRRSQCIMQREGGTLREAMDSLIGALQGVVDVLKKGDEWQIELADIGT